VECAYETFQRSPSNLFSKKVQNYACIIYIMHKRLKSHACKLQLVQIMNQEDCLPHATLLHHIEEDEATEFAFLMKQCFACVEQSVDTVALYGELKFL
jgi:hypothetical protein